MVKCDKCNGSGELSHYNHVQSGVCFKCCGTGSIDTPGKHYAANLAHHNARLDHTRTCNARRFWATVKEYKAILELDPTCRRTLAWKLATMTTK